jgi:hypothetical protein
MQLMKRTNATKDSALPKKKRQRYIKGPISRWSGINYDVVRIGMKRLSARDWLHVVIDLVWKEAWYKY